MGLWQELLPIEILIKHHIFICLCHNLFVCLRKWESMSGGEGVEGQRQRERGCRRLHTQCKVWSGSTLSAESEAGLHLTTLRPRPEPASRVRHSWATRLPLCCIWVTKMVCSCRALCLTYGLWSYQARFLTPVLTCVCFFPTHRQVIN